MKFNLATSLVMILLAGPVQPGETSENRQPTELIAKMIEAHGGMEAWRKINTLYVERWQRRYGRGGQPAGRDWEFTITADLHGWRTYEVWWENQHVAWDGEKGWSKDYQLPFPAKFVATIGLYLSNIVWKTQDPGVHFGEPRRKADLFPGCDKEYITIKMTFDKGVGITWDDYFVLFIDPDTFLMKGCLIHQTYAATLPPGRDAAEFNYVIKNYEKMAGLTLPGEFSTYFLNNAKLADGKFFNWKANIAFDESRLKMPYGGVPDTSSPRREGSK